MILKHCILLIALAALMTFLAVPSSATPIPFAIKGTVIEMNETAQTLTIRAECQQYPCQYNLTGAFSGRVPNTIVFSRVKKGEIVEAVFKEWTFQVTDPSTGYTVPSAETRNLRQWYTIQRLARVPGTDTFVSTELFGDTAVNRVPFLGNYTIHYHLSGPSPGKYDYQSFPPETIANISVSRDSGLVLSETLAPGDSCSSADRQNGTALMLQFVGGYDAGPMAVKACPCASFHIRVLAGNESDPTAWQETRPTGSPVNTPLDPLAAIAAPGILLGVGGVIRK